MGGGEFQNDVFGGDNSCEHTTWPDHWRHHDGLYKHDYLEDLRICVIIWKVIQTLLTKGFPTITCRMIMMNDGCH